MEKEQAERIHAAVLLIIAEQKLKDLGLEDLSKEMGGSAEAILTGSHK